MRTTEKAPAAANTGSEPAIEVAPYSANDHAHWDDFIARSKNATFMLDRDYMDYHADRFQDASLVFYSRPGQIAALVPANREGDTIYSHGGLTYGGVLSDERMTTPIMLRVFDAMLGYFESVGIRRLLYKAIPHIYHSLPAEEDLYALSLCGAKLVRRDVSTVIGQGCRGPVRKGAQHSRDQAARAKLNLRESTDFATFWTILEENLAARHMARPVHSLAEIRLLQERFPQNIRLFGCFRGEEMLAGAVVYESDRVAHTQYISASVAGKRVGALHLLLEWLITDQYGAKRWWDFGHSNEDAGRKLNAGLIENKEGFGGRAVVYDQYEIDLTKTPRDLARALFRR
jgi:hypothetical protein